MQAMNAAMLIHPTVIRAITGTLRKFGVRWGEIEDGVVEVQTRTLEYLRGKLQPEAVEEWAAICVTVAKHWRMDENEKRKTEKKYCVGLCEDPDEHVGLERAVDSRENIDAKRMVEVLRQQFEAGEMPEKGKEILDCMQAGLDYQETAAEVGINRRGGCGGLKRMQELSSRRDSGTLGMTVMVVTIMVDGRRLANEGVCQVTGAHGLPPWPWRFPPPDPRRG